MPERAWYQRGSTVLGIVVFAVWAIPLLYQGWQQSQMVHVNPQVAGCINQPTFGEPSFEVHIWHQHSGNLRNGTFTVSVATDMLKNPEGTESTMHSFEVWEPNRENAVKFKFPLRRFDPHQEIQFSVLLAGKNISTYYYADTWLGSDWKSNQEPERH